MRHPARLVVDASVAVKWYVPETDHLKATALLEQGHDLVAPELIIPELGNIFGKKVRRGELAPDEAQGFAEVFVTRCPVTLRPMLAVFGSALRLSLDMGHPVYDMSYLALAIMEDRKLVTADNRLLRAVSGTELAQFVVALSERP